ncbi:MAG: biotin--[Lachnospiraceae bacterium]|nr:biotin--[acetyl-CoA-carboxylase] ligase [Lachnospiraceae bacterium]
RRERLDDRWESATRAWKVSPKVTDGVFDNMSDRFNRILVLDEIDSTNRLLMQMAGERAPDRQVIIADHQSAGRGRLGRAFSSPAGMGVYLSYLIRPGETPHPTPAGATFPPGGRSGSVALPGGRLGTSAAMGAAAWTAVTSWTAVAVSDAIERVSGLRPAIKWVNDLYLPESAHAGTDTTGKSASRTGTNLGRRTAHAGTDPGRKICGILTQMDMDAESGEVRSIVIGIGVNVNERKLDFNKEIRDIAGSLRMATGERVNRAQLAAEMIRALDEMYDAWPEEHERYLRAYREASLLPGRKVNVVSGASTRKATALSVGDDFSLKVRYEDNSTESLTGGEVSIRM